ncbi:MAG TPA: GspH/FimT family pseudopilin [Pirellulaceae bacterium]|nr:GspH/FimT family pseudopilin [Pirellulaceae bacterium]
MSGATKSLSRRGFTLADLMITVLIIGILSAVSTPRMIDTFSELQLEAAAKQVASDLRYARQCAKTGGRNQSVTFNPGNNSYELNGMKDIFRSSKPFVVVLPNSSYPANINSATFGAGAVVTFDMYGRPDNGGAVVVGKDGATKTVQVNATTGEVSIP